ncbi:hypothetical protein GCM10009000_100860 [Halobacterium noricense]
MVRTKLTARNSFVFAEVCGGPPVRNKNNTITLVILIGIALMVIVGYQALLSGTLVFPLELLVVVIVSFQGSAYATWPPQEFTFSHHAALPEQLGFLGVEAAGTTKECAKCGVETAKPIWAREHSCVSCGFEANWEANAVMSVLQAGLLC